LGLFLTFLTLFFKVVRSCFERKGRILRTRTKGFSIVYIPNRGKTKSFHISVFVIYIALLILFGSSYFVFQFYVNLASLKTNYIAMTTFSEEEKQQIMSEELSVIQQEMASTNIIHSKNLEKMTPISNLDKEDRTKLNLRKNDLNPDKFLTKNNKNLSSSGINLALKTIYDLKERVVKQNISLQNLNRTLEIASISGNDFNAEDAKTPIGYPYPGIIDPGFGYRIHPILRTPDFHTGVDISVPYGDNLVATGDGIVTGAGYAGGYGYMITIYHRDGISTRYAHCSKLIAVPGQKVKRGQIIAKAGATGMATNSHVHYEILREQTPVDPEEFNRMVKSSGR
jgi:murein DD-endopeptidase MepM/ murein hydrolase activator NlpD